MAGGGITPRRGGGRRSGLRVRQDSSVENSKPPLQPQGRSLSELLGRGISRIDSTANTTTAALTSSASKSVWADITSTLEHIAPASQQVVVEEEENEFNEVVEKIDIPEDVALNNQDNDCLPRDESLRESLIINSSYPLNWTLSRSADAECFAVSRISAGGEPHPTQELCNLLDTGTEPIRDNNEMVDMEAMREFCTALLQYRHPSTALSPIELKHWSRDIEQHGSRAHLRVSRWQEAFRALFYAYRHGYVGHFYIRLSTTVARFGRTTASLPYRTESGNSLSGTCRVTFSRATAGLRELLATYGVGFQTQDGETGDPEPCVVVEGDRETHALYNLITAAGPTLADANDVPELISDWPFRWGTLVSATPKNARTIVVAKDAPIRYSVEIEGTLTPIQVGRLYTALCVSQARRFEMHLKTEKFALRLNVCAADADSALGANVVSRIRCGEPDGKLSVFTIAAE